jgi:hypothetical protein
VPLNVYEGERPVCQCHMESDARRIVAAMNSRRAAPLVNQPRPFVTNPCHAQPPPVKATE